MIFNKTIYLDVDNTILPAEKRLIEIYNKYYKTNGLKDIDYTKITTWDCGLDRNIVEEIFSIHDFYSDIELYPNVKSVLSKLRKRGYKIIIYSKGTLGNIHSKTIFLEYELENFIDGHIFIGSKNVTMGKSIVNMEGSMIIDDHIKNLEGNNTMYNVCAKLTDNIVDWNKDFKEDVSKGNFVMHEWNDLLKIIDMIEIL